MVEFALSIFLFLFLILGVVEFGYFIFIYGSVFSASREAVRYGSSVGTNALGVAHEKDCAGIRDAALRIAGFAGITPANVDIRYDKGPDDPRPWADLPTCESNPATQLGDRINVQIQIGYQPLVGLIPPTTIQSQDARTIIKEVDINPDFSVPTAVSPTSTSSPAATTTPEPEH